MYCLYDFIYYRYTEDRILDALIFSWAKLSDTASYNI